VVDHVLTVVDHSHITRYKLYAFGSIGLYAQNLLQCFVATFDIAAADHHAGTFLQKNLRAG
jgi:hypothetical protein